MQFEKDDVSKDNQQKCASIMVKINQMNVHRVENHINFYVACGDIKKLNAAKNHNIRVHIVHIVQNINQVFNDIFLDT